MKLNPSMSRNQKQTCDEKSIDSWTKKLVLLQKKWISRCFPKAKVYTTTHIVGLFEGIQFLRRFGTTITCQTSRLPLQFVQPAREWVPSQENVDLLVFSWTAEGRTTPVWVVFVWDVFLFVILIILMLHCQNLYWQCQSANEETLKDPNEARSFPVAPARTCLSIK